MTIEIGKPATLTKLVPSVADVLGPQGRIAKLLPSYESRPQQLAMASAVAEAFEQGGHLLVDAGTGVGKSFAYLVPAIQHATDHGGRVVISTHTIALQEQLMNKDVPFLKSIFPDKFTCELLKGRGNYLGIRRLSRASGRQGMLFETDDQLAELHRIEDWAYKTEDGTLSDLPTQPNLAVWDRIRSDGDDCMGRKCEHFDKCFYQVARRRAAQAHLIIVNHALLFTDLAMRMDDAALLPEYDYLVLDEAHTVESVAGDHMGLNVANTQVRYLLNSLYNERNGHGVLSALRGKSMIPMVNQTRRLMDEYFDSLALWRHQRPSWNGRLTEPPPLQDELSSGLVELQQGLRAMRGDVKGEQDKLELMSYSERCRSLASSITDWHLQRAKDWVYWIEVEPDRRKRVTLAGRPIDVGAALKQMLFDRVKTVVLTSATLTTGRGDAFSYIKQRLGLEQPRALEVGSPFDYRTQMKTYVEAGMPDPSDTAKFLPAACEKIRKYLTLSDGRAFLLFTSYDMLQKSVEQLTDFLNAQEMPFFVQGGAIPRGIMLDRFKTTPRSVLFGTDTFWAGVDVPGEALSNVIIVKLPFASPTQPAVEAKIEKLRRDGGNPFMDFQVPEAVLKFRQGIGRLIRTKTDRGIIVILDPRVVTKHYGRFFLNALPECEVVINR